MATLGERLREREHLIGCFQNISAPEATEAAAAAGVDFVVVDTEHGPVGDQQIATLVRVAEAAGIALLVRLAQGDRPRVGRLLDAGAAGIMIAHVRSADEAAHIVAATRYPPEGERSAAGSRVTAWGRKMNLAEFAASAAARPTVIAMTEDRDGVEKAAAIASVPGVDGLFVGTSDLSIDVGVPGEAGHREVASRVATVCETAREHGVSAGVPLTADSDASTAFAGGATFVATGDVGALIVGLERFRASALHD